MLLSFSSLLSSALFFSVPHDQSLRLYRVEANWGLRHFSDALTDLDYLCGLRPNWTEVRDTCGSGETGFVVFSLQPSTLKSRAPISARLTSVSVCWISQSQFSSFVTHTHVTINRSMFWLSSQIQSYGWYWYLLWCEPASGTPSEENWCHRSVAGPLS